MKKLSLAATISGMLCLSACAATNHYEPLQPINMAQVTSCTKIKSETARVEKYLAEVRAKRNVFTEDDLTGFIEDFGAANQHVGSIAEADGERELGRLHDRAKEKHCAITSTTID